MATHDSKTVPQVMVSSTFTDLKTHREAMIKAIRDLKLSPNVMEHHGAKPDKDVVDSSLQMVRDSAAYVLVISLKYGQTPECPERNPDQLSITELEFNEAQRLGRPILLFVMGDDHPGKKADFERDPEKEKKLDAFRERAKKAASDSEVNRVYSVFNSLNEFKDKIAAPLADLRDHLLSSTSEKSGEGERSYDPDFIPSPPAFYAEPDYIGSHQFVGRARELEDLSDWAKPADPTNLLLFEAIGGNGKSMLTWEWTTKHATQVRDDWAGRFWYSFYERGAIMADFCQRALAYMTSRPLKELRKKKTAELREPLLAQLHAKPWLLILDGLERVLVAYHRIDAAEIRDEEVDVATDQIAKRIPTDAIRDEDNDLLRALAAATPSKILVSSRLTPRVLLNPSGQPITGAKRITFPGLRPSDAEHLLRSCGVEGDSAAILSYLTTNCDNHPLVIGILGGLIHNYLPERGNFDAWAADPDGGAKLDLASLDLIQRRNHILRAALDDLPPTSRQLLSTLALLSESVDYETLSAFNPHLPPTLEPEEVPKPTPPEKHKRWEKRWAEHRAEMRIQYEADLARWKDYERTMEARSAEHRAATKELTATVTDLEQRSLLQYDGRTRRHDLHPVVRGVAAGGMHVKAKQQYDRRVVDYFSSQSRDPYAQAESLEDISPGMHIVRTLLKMGRYHQAFAAFNGDLSRTMQNKFEARAEILSLLKPFFPDGWGTLSPHLDKWKSFELAVLANHQLRATGQLDEAIEAGGALIFRAIDEQNRSAVERTLVSIASTCSVQNRIQKEDLCRLLALEIADNRRRKHVWLGRLHQLSKMGRSEDSSDLSVTGTKDFEALARRHNAFSLFWNGNLNEQELAEAEKLAQRARNRHTSRDLLRLRAHWRLEQEEWALAAASFAEAVRMARESGISDAESETGLALAKHHLGQLAEPQREAERLTQLRQPAHRLLAQLWLALGDHEQAKHHALAAYKWAWADGEPYVHRYELTRSSELLQEMNVPIPNLPPYDPDKDEPFPWEADVRAAIEKLKAEKEAEQ